MEIRMEIKINPKEESSKTLRELAHFLLRLSVDKGRTGDKRIMSDFKEGIKEGIGDMWESSWDNDYINDKEKRSKDIFNTLNQSDSKRLDESKSQIPSGMFSLFDAPISNSAINSIDSNQTESNHNPSLKGGFSSLINSYIDDKHISDDSVFYGKDVGQHKDGSVGEKSDMVYDISEFFY